MEISFLALGGGGHGLDHLLEVLGVGDFRLPRSRALEHRNELIDAGKEYVDDVARSNQPSLAHQIQQ